jgi:acyl-CoA-dependent ceramide synthase
MVLVLHDGCDIFLESSKMLNYCGAPGQAFCFLCLIISWAVGRLVIYPITILHTTLYESVNFFKRQVEGYWILNASLFALLLLNTYWFFLICKIAWRVVQGKKGSDIREDKIE